MKTQKLGLIRNSYGISSGRDAAIHANSVEKKPIRKLLQHKLTVPSDPQSERLRVVELDAMG